MHIQRRLPRGLTREHAFSCIHPRIRSKILADAKRYNVSPSWVIHTALAAIYNVEVESFTDVDKREK